MSSELDGHIYNLAQEKAALQVKFDHIIRVLKVAQESDDPEHGKKWAADYLIAKYLP